MILGAVTDSAAPTDNTPIENINKVSSKTIGSARSGKTSETTGAGQIDHTTPGKMYKT